ncbi:MAG: hypothetical protein Q4P83_03590 [Spirochaetales bacterium]|jgi:hypothetical protein|uniref:Outer membrane protein beta-barrel domain-containing protein n=1 Tax=Treponema berlinense TaxID=225004 RepID=A0A1T4PQE1_9SPIR|nr:MULTISPECIES: hypothetical protein [Treponema]MDO5766682.1 hypothetical protein [Spirochaetales bacterium]MBQ9102648.1 hypothetical protein [Treponema sp.]MCI5541990.1 hypothetical protein [Treponema berlinense]MDD5834920.1 hypothetical protein [Treponema berlinense]MDY3707349.1 hypothetical protein [Treponema berlinense]
MKKFIAICCTVFLFSTAVFSQEQDEDDDRFAVEYRMNEPGDQFINIGLMVTFPLNFGGDFPLYREGQLSTGGAGTIGYHRFLTSWFAVGLDVSFGYNPTIGENMFTYVPFVFCFTVQPTIKKFEFPITMGIGAAVESYLNRTYFPGLTLKPEAGIFYRVTPSWSFGIKGNFMYLPQWYEDSENNDHGNFSSVVIAARYHF